MCKVRTGAYVANNNIHGLSHSDAARRLYGIALGHVETIDGKNTTLEANNVIVINNTIHDMIVPAGIIQPGYGIFVEGRNMKILNNHVENIQGYTGIYSKGYGIVHKENTLINAGRLYAICIKNFDATDDDVLIENNTITGILDDTNSIYAGYYGLGINMEAGRFKILNNWFSMTSNYTGHYESAAVWLNYPIVKGIVEGNTIYSERASAICVNNGVTGTLTIEGNDITQRMQSASVTGGNLLYWKTIASTAVINCKDNTINLDRGKHLSYSLSSDPGSTLNMTGNTIDIRTSVVSAMLLSNITLNLLHNTVNLNANLESTARAGGILSGGTPAAPYRVEDNIINCKTMDTAYLFTMPLLFTMLRNQINFDPGCALLSVVDYRPSDNAGSYDITTAADNILGDIQAALGGSAANADYFIRFYLSGGYAFPEIVIRDNVAVVKQRLINRSVSGGGIPSVGAITATYNSVYSEQYNDNDAVIIDTALREPNLVLANNTSLRGGGN